VTLGTHAVVVGHAALERHGDHARVRFVAVVVGCDGCAHADTQDDPDEQRETRDEQRLHTGRLTA
jgi:hypothetical protein